MDDETLRGKAERLAKRIRAQVQPNGSILTMNADAKKLLLDAKNTLRALAAANARLAGERDAARKIVDDLQAIFPGIRPEFILVNLPVFLREQEDMSNENDQLEAQRDAATALAEELRAEVGRMQRALGGFIYWADRKCPCHNDEPNPCPLCGASIENLEACKAADETLPRAVLTEARAALAQPAPAAASKGEAGE